MSLETRLAALITAIGADIKALTNRVDDQHAASSTNQVVSGNTDTYLAGSAIAIPQGKIKVGTKYRCKLNVVKTNAATAAPVFNVRVGTGAVVGDGSRATLTFAAQTGAVDEGVFEFECVFRQAGGTALIQARGSLLHRLVTTGLNVTGVFTNVLNTGGTFDATAANLKIGMSLNAGSSSNWTISIVSAELVNLTS